MYLYVAHVRTYNNKKKKLVCTGTLNYKFIQQILIFKITIIL